MQWLDGNALVVTVRISSGVKRGNSQVGGQMVVEQICQDLFLQE
jgi:hypothetical protein